MGEHQGACSGRRDLPGYLRRYAAEVDGWRRHTQVCRTGSAQHGGDHKAPESGADGIGRRDLEQALEAGEFHLVYQPWMDMTSGSYSTVEALLRWHRPVSGPIGPAEFIPVAERTGFIVRLGAWVIDQACRQLRAWRESDSSAARLRMAVNLSPCQLGDPRLAATVLNALAENELEPAALCLEVTESAVMEDSGGGLDTLSALRDLGVVIAVDDFGTGYSSLAQLKRLPVDVVKVPRDFVVDLGDDPRDAAIITAVAELAHALGMRVVAEGVETIWQAIAVRALGVELVQGFYFAAPRRGSDIPAIVDRPQAETPSESGLATPLRLSA
jgi:EAL domain-containing protein (putative c-di-GMP-specific phosphodiesterase class I)